ncbi:MAG: hypothetical protein PHT59_03920 [Candidatus Omnitrophica bacterium]|nr:hypothetical protein [Candidatus Omnitrophota bacterium]
MNDYKILTTGFAVLVSVVAAGAGAYAQDEVVAGPDVSYAAADRRDPFKDSLPIDLPMTVEPAAEDVKPPEMTIQGIFWGGQFPQAIVNEKIIKVGDTIQEATVVGIDKEGITIRVSNREFRMPAPGSQVVMPAMAGGPQGGYSRDAQSQPDAGNP